MTERIEILDVMPVVQEHNIFWAILSTFYHPRRHWTKRKDVAWKLYSTQQDAVESLKIKTHTQDWRDSDEDSSHSIGTGTQQTNQRRVANPRHDSGGPCRGPWAHLLGHGRLATNGCPKCNDGGQTKSKLFVARSSHNLSRALPQLNPTYQVVLLY